ncbi:ArsR/SmtB family transcription factor [Enterococcus alcedinis]|uniref:Transcriptional regulator n=1 Tax=Enterococcus alcedinis TaxID=1274384 RepID=A0A917JIN5_9ENTE|nr:metalloregulator ArsR/SmtB family transcription factor [Enterococcus alcedinis]MBP2102971.1 ArsR family transcriptional regulator [Enterococcus alcedinis]GGI66555.1 transcriptional regulator [Enterococcus alcedinis]
MNYEELSVMLKALANPKRLKIIDLLSCGSLCACDLLDHFDFTQPTLSHHMKLLENVGVVRVTKEGIWHRYELTDRFVEQFLDSMAQLFSKDENCICSVPLCNCQKEEKDEK